MPTPAPNLTPAAQASAQALGATVRTQRKALSVTATALAEAAGVSRVTVYRIEKGEPSVTLGAYANVLAALGLALHVSPDGAHATSAAPPGWLPARVRLADYPQLRSLAWHMPGAQALSPAQAWSLYQRNARHMDDAALTPAERQLMQALQQAFADDAVPPDLPDGV